MLLYLNVSVLELFDGLDVGGLVKLKDRLRNYVSHLVGGIDHLSRNQIFEIQICTNLSASGI